MVYLYYTTLYFIIFKGMADQQPHRLIELLFQNQAAAVSQADNAFTKDYYFQLKINRFKEW